ncbi:DUF7537 family lipoprotein [Haloarchaeobius sp. DFWS5]|uniref:DUF7537 family lipoprotein n=1 Tax=Haloarchaeobius sp. DFWS5 TaxID=3446114 RepID=UPI003EBA4738
MVRQQSLRCILLVTVVVLAGCGGFAGEQTTRAPYSVETTDTETTTGTAVSDAGREPRFDPDPKNDSIGDTEHFLDSQSTVLNGTSYRFVYSYEVVAANGTTLFRTARRGAFAEDESVLHVVRETSGPVAPMQATRELYANGTALFERFITDGNATAQVVRGPDGDPVNLTATSVDDVRTVGRAQGTNVQFLYTSFEMVDVTSVEELGRVRPGLAEPLYRIEGETDRATTSFQTYPELSGQPTNVTLTAIVDANGFVYDFRFGYESELEGEPVRVELTLSYQDVGKTTVERPPWVSNATTEQSPVQASRSS